MDDGWDAETVGDALDVLQDLVLWQLVPDRWSQVDRLLGRIAAAFAAGDADEVRAAVAYLELSGPVRALRIGTAGVDGIPEPVLERRNTLVHALVREQRRAAPASTSEQRRAAPTEESSGDHPAR
ncbi:CATRA system-associated protein [Symbioplanes lichenis]|uniref:CATRA system-associated protein n=1 Tax=Symbioplanes lichenis TaxID=1629072 RepID=UPI00273A3942|nr:CATRA system-associated protein [Actinoplanes lichenis]